MTPTAQYRAAALSLITVGIARARGTADDDTLDVAGQQLGELFPDADALPDEIRDPIIDLALAIGEITAEIVGALAIFTGLTIEQAWQAACLDLSTNPKGTTK